MEDFIRVPNPAARMMTVIGDAAVLDINPSALEKLINSILRALRHSERNSASSHTSEHYGNIRTDGSSVGPLTSSKKRGLPHGYLQ